MPPPVACPDPAGRTGILANAGARPRWPEYVRSL